MQRYREIINEINTKTQREVEETDKEDNKLKTLKWQGWTVILTWWINKILISF